MYEDAERDYDPEYVAGLLKQIDEQVENLESEAEAFSRKYNEAMLPFRLEWGDNLKFDQYAHITTANAYQTIEEYCPDAVIFELPKDIRDKEAEQEVIDDFHSYFQVRHQFLEEELEKETTWQRIKRGAKELFGETSEARLRKREHLSKIQLKFLYK